MKSIKLASSNLFSKFFLETFITNEPTWWTGLAVAHKRVRLISWRCSWYVGIFSWDPCLRQHTMRFKVSVYFALQTLQLKKSWAIWRCETPVSAPKMLYSLFINYRALIKRSDKDFVVHGLEEKCFKNSSFQHCKLCSTSAPKGLVEQVHRLNWSLLKI